MYSQETKTLSTSSCNLEDFNYWKKTNPKPKQTNKCLQKDSLQPSWKGPYQGLSANPFVPNLKEWTLGFTWHIQRKHQILTGSAHHLITKISWNWGQQYLITQTSQDVWTRSIRRFGIHRSLSFSSGILPNSGFLSKSHGFRIFNFTVLLTTHLVPTVLLR